MIKMHASPRKRVFKPPHKFSAFNARNSILNFKSANMAVGLILTTVKNKVDN